MSTVCGWKHLGENFVMHEYCVITKQHLISIGSNVRIDALCKIEGGEGVEIGDNVHLASGTKINVGGGKVIFGSHSGTSADVLILSGHPDLSYGYVTPTEKPENVHPVRKTTRIGQFVVIFAGAIIQPGVTIGDFAVVNAGAVVTKDVPNFAIVQGCPARVVGIREIIIR